MGGMKTFKPIQIFKPGTHTAMSGATLSFSESDLAAAAAAYDPARHEAPLVVGHPRHDNPAYGWVASLAFTEGALDAEPVQVNPDFAEMVKSGAFKKISAAFYSPSAPNNPVPGVYYLRHVGFLGAQAPAVKGLRTPEFSDTEEGVVEFADWGDMQNASLWRSLRDWIIGKFGLEEADKVVPGYTVSALEADAAQETDPAPLSSFTEPQPKGDAMSAEEKARLAELEAENARLKAEQAAFAEAEKTRVRAACHASHLSFSEGLIQAGKLLPAQKDVCVATLDFLAGQDTVVEFGEGDAKQPLADGLKAFLAALPKQVEFSEVAKVEGAGDTVEFAAPGGYAVDADRLEIHKKALAWQAAHPNTSYQTAVNAVGGN
jgi:hypothetical protein